MTSQTLPGETSGDTTTNWSYTVWCAPTGAQTPCVEIDQTQRVDSATTLTSRAFYDGWGHLIETRAPAPGGQDVVTYAEYDQAGRKSFQNMPYFVAAYTGAPGSSAFATPNTQPGTTYAYTSADGKSLLVNTVKDALGHTTTTTAGVVCAPVSGDSGCYVTTTTTDALNHQSVSYRDGLGRLAYSRAYTGTSGSGYTLYATTTQGYDPAGRLATVTRPDGATLSFSYDDAGRQTASHDPDRGSETASYDPNGNLLQTTDARGSSGTIYAGYDGLNRQLWRNTTNSPTGAYATYGYDSSASAGGIGRLTSETFSNANGGGSLSGSYAYSYDGRGQVTATTETVGGTPYTTSASYNDAGQLLSQTYPDGDTLATSYDPLSGWQQQESLTLSGQSTALPLLTAEAYNGAAGAMGLMTSASLGAFASLTSGASGSYAASYDALGRLTAESATYTPAGGSASTLYQVQPTYDQLGNVIETVTTLPQGVDTQVFCYDDLSRLTWAGSSGTPTCSGAPTPSDTGSLAGTGGASYSASYSYDALNRLTTAPLGSYSYGDAAHADAATTIGSAWSASYDAAGDLTCRAATSATTCSGSSPTGATLAYDNEGQLATWANAQSSPTSSAKYLYDGEGQRVEQVATTSGVTTTTTYVGSLEEIATTGTTTTTTSYYGGLATSVNGALSYTLADGLGSVSESVNAATGAVTATQLYAPYGAVRYQSGSLPGSRGFTGQHSDAATSGLDYYGARYYDPAAGQFTSADTTLAGGLNRYAYVGGNPETRTDPSGHMTRSPDYQRSRAMYEAQTQPPTAYAYQWAAPCDLGCTVKGVGKTVFATDTLKQSFHTIFQDPHASAGDKWKAAGVGAFTLATDGLTLVSLATFQPEVAEGAREADLAVVALDDGGHVATVATDAATDVASTVGDASAGDSSEPWYRGLRTDESPSNGLSPSNPSNRATALQHISLGSKSWYPGDQFISFTKDPVVAVSKYAGGDVSRVVEINPSLVSGSVYDLTSPSGRLAIGLTPGTPPWYYARADSEVLLEDGYVPPEAISPYSGPNLWSK